MRIPTVRRRGYPKPLLVTHPAVTRAVACKVLRGTVQGREEARERARYMAGLSCRCSAKWAALADKAHLEAFGTVRSFLDYKVSGIGRYEYPERYKPALRALARGASTAAALGALWGYVARYGRGWGV
jgi:hypothetical protein